MNDLYVIDAMLIKDICAIVTNPGNYCMAYIREPKCWIVTYYDYTSSMIFIKDITLFLN